MAKLGPKVIDASPTKEFFIYMLTKDIKLLRAIIDLVDNSWDGAIRIADSAEFDHLWIRIELNEDEFKISDNCGGIPYDIAKNYAFRFGRPKDMAPTDHSIGQFGVGMKRSLFKLGRKFRIESKSQDSKFVVQADVDEWVKHDKWEFNFESHEKFERKRPLSSCGTTITVSELYDGVQFEFKSQIFETQLKEAIESAHQQSINQKIAISLNQVPLKAPIAKLCQSSELKSAHQTLQFDEDEVNPVTVKLFSGISDSDPQAAGWSIFCNGRLVLEADGSLVTGWGEGNGKIIPRHHNQFARFRGYVFFDCDDASKLPWNTTKTGVDTDSRIYQTVRQRMIEMMRPVIDFLNQVDAEKEKEPRYQYLTQAADSATQRKLPGIAASPHFVAPSVSQQKKKMPATQRIQYSRPKEEIELVKETLEVSTLKEVGEATFDYYFELECE